MYPVDRTTASLFLPCVTCHVRTWDPQQLYKHVVYSQHETTCPVCYEKKRPEVFLLHVSRCYAPYNCWDCQAVISVRGVVRHLRRYHREGGFYCPVGCTYRYQSVEHYLYGRVDHDCN